jgi:hypothetical protein
MALSGRTLSKHVGKDAGSVVVRDGLFLAAATALLSLAGCTNLGTALLVEGAPVSGHVRLSEGQVGYMGGGGRQKEK